MKLLQDIYIKNTPTLPSAPHASNWNDACSHNRFVSSLLSQLLDPIRVLTVYLFIFFILMTQGTDDFCILWIGRDLATTQCNRLSNMTSQGRTKLCVEVNVFQWKKKKKAEGYVTTQLTLFVKASGVKKKKRSRYIGGALFTCQQRAGQTFF